MAISQGADKEELKKCASMLQEYLMLQKRIAQIESWLEAVKSDGRVHVVSSLTVQ